MANIIGDTRDGTLDRLYELADGQSGFLTAQQAIDAGVARSTLTYHARPDGTLERVARGVYRWRRYPTTPHEHVVRAWLTLSPADGVVSHVSALELHDLTDLIADDVHITLPRDKRGITVPEGVHAHFSARPVTGRDRRTVHGIPVTSIERTLTDVLRSTGWTEQTNDAITRALARGQTTAKRLTDALPATWHGRIRSLTREEAS